MEDFIVKVYTEHSLRTVSIKSDRKFYRMRNVQRVKEKMSNCKETILCHIWYQFFLTKKKYRGLYSGNLAVNLSSKNALPQKSNSPLVHPVS